MAGVLDCLPQAGRPTSKSVSGQAENLTLDRLNNAAALLASSDDIPVDPIPDTTAQDTRSPRADATATVGTTTTSDRAHKRPHPGTSGDFLLSTKRRRPASPTLLGSASAPDRAFARGSRASSPSSRAPAGFGKSTLLRAALAAPFSNDRSAAGLR